MEMGCRMVIPPGRQHVELDNRDPAIDLSREPTTPNSAALGDPRRRGAAFLQQCVDTRLGAILDITHEGNDKPGEKEPSISGASFMGAVMSLSATPTLTGQAIKLHVALPEYTFHPSRRSCKLALKTTSHRGLIVL